MKTRFTLLPLLVLTALVCALLVQSHLDAACMKYHADGARWTVQGTYCWRDLNGLFREYYPLKDLREKHEGPQVDQTIHPAPAPADL